MAIKTITDLPETTSPPNSGAMWLQTDTEDYKVTLQTITEQIKTSIFDSIIPIGFVYVQLPGTLEPAQLWPEATWGNISADFPAQFMRIEGTFDADHVATAFGSGVQMDTVQPHEHSIESDRAGFSGQTNPGTDWGGIAATTTAGPTYQFYAGAGRSGTIDTETRPLNITVRVWKRIA